MTSPENPEKLKNRTLFDHINNIRDSKNPDYYKTLNETEVGSFNKYVITTGLSMDISSIENISKISKYFDILPNAAFYTLCCKLTPIGKRYPKWIKSSSTPVSNTLLEIVATHFSVSKQDAYNYCLIFFKDETTLNEIVKICMSRGYSEDEIVKILEGKE
jgi:hypothetical protein